MRRTKRDGGVLSLLYKSLCIGILLLGLFGIIRLRSAILTVHYDIRSLEEEKMSSIKEMKILSAEREKYSSLEKIEASFQSSAGAGRSALVADNDNEFGNRVRIVHVKRLKAPEPLKTAVAMRTK
jgi:hypothetical protein